jgi:hypothetical protein
MSKTLLPLIICFLTFNATLLHAQEFSFGLKGGINKTYGGIITGDDAEIPDEYSSATFTAVGEIGLHGGIWTQVNFGRFFIRPEIVYSKLKSRFDFPQGPRLYEVEEFSAPVLVGYNIYKPVDIYAGIAYKNILDATLEGNEPVTDTPQIVVQNTPLSAQIGAKVEFGNFGLDVRYDHSFSSKKSQDVNIFSDWYSFPDPVMDRGVMEDARLHQIIVSLTVKLFHSKNEGKKRRRGCNCSY